MMDADESSQVELNCPMISSQTINEYTTKHLLVMCFPGRFLNGIGDPITKVLQCDVTIANAGNH